MVLSFVIFFFNVHDITLLGVMQLMEQIQKPLNVFEKKFIENNDFLISH